MEPDPKKPREDVHLDVYQVLPDIAPRLVNQIRWLMYGGELSKKDAFLPEEEINVKALESVSRRIPIVYPMGESQFLRATRSFGFAAPQRSEVENWDLVVSTVHALAGPGPLTAKNMAIFAWAMITVENRRKGSQFYDLVSVGLKLFDITLKAMVKRRSLLVDWTSEILTRLRGDLSMPGLLEQIRDASKRETDQPHRLMKLSHMTVLKAVASLVKSQFGTESGWLRAYAKKLIHDWILKQPRDQRLRLEELWRVSLFMVRLATGKSPYFMSKVSLEDLDPKRDYTMLEGYGYPHKNILAFQLQDAAMASYLWVFLKNQSATQFLVDGDVLQAFYDIIIGNLLPVGSPLLFEHLHFLCYGRGAGDDQDAIHRAISSIGHLIRFPIEDAVGAPSTITDPIRSGLMEPVTTTSGSMEKSGQFVNNPDAWWELLSSKKGQKQVLEALSSRGFARHQREGKCHSIGDGVGIWPMPPKISSELVRALEEKPEAVGIFAGRKRRRVIGALLLYVDSLPRDQDLGGLRENAEYVGALLGSMITRARRRNQPKMLRTVDYLVSVLTVLSQTNPERATAALVDVKTAVARAQLRLLTRKTAIYGGPRIDDRDVGGGPHIQALVSGIRSVVWDRMDVKSAGRDLAQAISGRAPLTIWRSIHVVHYALLFLINNYMSSVISDPAMLDLERSLKDVPESLVTAALQEGGTTLLWIPSETTVAQIREFVIEKNARRRSMLNLTRTAVYHAVEGKSDILRRDADGALIKIEHKVKVRGLTVFCASYVKQ